MDAKLYIDNIFDKLKLLHQSEKTEIWLVMNCQDQKLYVLKIIGRLGLPYNQLSKLEHQGLPEIRYVFEDNEYTYVIEEYLQGRTAAQWIEENGFLNEDQVENIIKQLCQSLIFLHSHQIIHRDIKPSNIFFTDDGRVKLIDFDAARIKKKNQSNDTVCLGTKGFAAPEQYGSQATDERSDIYAFGVTVKALLGEAYCGRLLSIVDKCTEFDAKYRFQDFYSLEMALQSSMLVKKNNLWKIAITYQIYHFPLFIAGLGLFLFIVSSGYPDDWYKYEEIIFHIKAAIVFFVIYLCWRQRVFLKKKKKNRDLLPIEKETHQLKKGVFLLWYYIVWVMALCILVSSIGISYSLPWEKMVCQMVFILPIFLSYGSFRWYLIKRDF